MIIIYTLLITAGSLSSPIWSSWMKDIVKKNIGSYFGKRSRIIYTIIFTSMIVAGLILDHFNKSSVFIGFTILFSIALIGRSISAYLLSKQYEPKLKVNDGYFFSFIDFTKKMRHNNYGRFVIFTTLILFATGIASPFFTVYMLRDLNFSYLEFTLITLSSLLSKFLTLSFWGRFSDKFGNIKTLKITSWIIPLVPFLWIVAPVSNHSILVPYLFLAELVSGFCWAGFNLASGNFLYDAVSRERVAICGAYDNAINAIGTFVGVTIGSLILAFAPSVLGLKTIIAVFIISGIMRFLIPLFMASSIKEVRPVDELKSEHIRKRIKEKIERAKAIKEMIF